MEDIDGSNFGVVDYCFFAAMLVVSLVIGAVAWFRGNKSPEEFLMGNRAFGAVPIAMSLLTSFVSAISLLGFSGETYAYGMQIVWFCVGVVLGIATAGVVTLPVIHPLKLISVNQYLLLRFNSPRLCRTISVIAILKGIVYMGIALYAPTLALATVTPLSSFTYVFILGSVVTLYSSVGGMRAVVWTDVFQLVVMVMGLIIIVSVGCYEVGGPGQVWNTSLAGGRLEIFDLNPSVYVRHTLWNTIGFGFLLCASFFGISQINVQRLCSVPTVEDAKRVLWINVFGMVFIYILIFFGGIISYTAYAGCDPWLLGILEKKEEIMPHFMVDKLSFITGLSGVFVATIVGGALSSISSSMSAVVAMTWEDVLSHWSFFEDMKPATAGAINKILSFIVGGLAMGVALLSKKATNLVQFNHTISSVTYGPILGLFGIGLLFPKTNTIGVWTGITLSMLLNGWISVGAFLYKKSAPTLPFSIEECPPLLLNVTDIDPAKNIYHMTSSNTTFDDVIPEDENDFPLMALYGISYTVYGLLGTTVCITVAILVSCITGNQDVKEVAPKYISPLVRKLYWDKQYLEEMELEEDKMKSNKHERNGCSKDIELDLLQSKAEI